MNIPYNEQERGQVLLYQTEVGELSREATVAKCATVQMEAV